MTRIPNPAYMSYGNTAGTVRASRTSQGFAGGLFFGPVTTLVDNDIVPPDVALVIANTGGATVNLTLPTASFVEGQGVFIKRNGANTVVVTPTTGNIDNAGLYTLTVDLQSVLFVRNANGLTFAASFFVAAAYLEP